MTRAEGGLSRDAKMLRDRYGIAYTVALSLLKKFGRDGALEHLAARFPEGFTDQNSVDDTVAMHAIPTRKDAPMATDDTATPPSPVYPIRTLGDLCKAVDRGDHVNLPPDEVADIRIFNEIRTAAAKQKAARDLRDAARRLRGEDAGGEFSARARQDANVVAWGGFALVRVALTGLSANATHADAAKGLLALKELTEVLGALGGAPEGA